MVKPPWCQESALIASAASPGRAPWKAERAERARLAPLGTTKEVLGFIIDFLACNLDFLGFPVIVSGFPRIYIRILS